MTRDRWLWAVLLLGAALRLYGLGERSLSYDECQQFWASQGSFLISNREITLDPPLFPALLHLHSLVGRSETWLRLLPCLLGILGIPAVYVLGYRLAGDRLTARVAAFFFSLAPYPIRYSQSLRVYSLTLWLCALLLAAWLAALENNNPHRRWCVAALAGLGLLAMYGVVWLAGALLAVLLFLPALRKVPGRVRLACTLGAGMAAAVPLYVISLPTQMAQGTPPTFYEDKFLPRDSLPGALEFLGKGTLDLFGYYSFIHPASGALFGALAVLGMIRLGRTREVSASVGVFVVAVAGAAAASALRLYPFGATRQMLYAAPLFYVFAAGGITSLRSWVRGWVTAILLAVIAAGCGVFLYRYHREPGGQEMRPVANYLAHHAQSGDRILVNKDAIPQFRFYYHGDPEAVTWGRETVIRDYVAEVNDVINSAPPQRWWLVFSHGWTEDRRARLMAVDARFVLTDRFEAHRAAAYLFAPRAEGASAPPER